jgi:hypothetical protein
LRRSAECGRIVKHAARRRSESPRARATLGKTRISQPNRRIRPLCHGAGAAGKESCNEGTDAVQRGGRRHWFDGRGAGFARESAVQCTSPTASQVLVNKEVGEDRWVITYRKSDGQTVGNVFTASGSAVFLPCTRSGAA